MEELLKIAKEKYPIGCKIIPLNLAYMGKGTEFQVIESLEHKEYNNAKEIWVNTGEFNSQIYWDGKWAEIINSPEVVEKDFFETAYTSLCKMQQAKDRKYGNSALSDKFNLFDGKTKLAPRLKDKLNRINNSPILLKNDVSDLMGYLMLVCKENNWNNFEDLID